VAKNNFPIISACLIVRNEEKSLAGCLRSIENAVDEIVVVDTGSKDRTVGIAEEFGAKVFHFEWRDDFSAARNFAKAQATGNWIFQIDADEELYASDRSQVRSFAASEMADIGLVAIHNLSVSDFGDNAPQVHFLARIFRNLPDIYYENAVHENLKLTRTAVHSGVKIVHHGYNLSPQLLREKRTRNGRILASQVAQEPDNPIPHFYLSSQYLAEKKYSDANRHARAACQLVDPAQAEFAHFYLMSLSNLCLIALELNDHVGVEKYSHQALGVCKDYLPPQFWLGTSLYRQQKYDEAKEVFKGYVRKARAQGQKKEVALYEHSSQTYLFQVMHMLGKIYRKAGATDLAAEMFQESVRLNPDFWIGYADLGYLSHETGNHAQAAVFLNQAFKIAKASKQVHPGNSMLWQDFVNLSKSLMSLLKQNETTEPAPRPQRVCPK